MQKVTQLFKASLTGQTQAMADAILDVRKSHNVRGTEPCDHWQAHFEIYDANGDAHVPAAGTAAVYGVPVGATFSETDHVDGNVDRGMMLLGTVDLTNADHSALMVNMGNYPQAWDYFVIVPDSLDADVSYDFIVTAW